MIRVTSIEQIRAIEKEADANGYSYDDMMASAGRATADRALALIEDIEEPRVTVLVGSGNNGGDGLVAGLFIAQDRQEAEVRFYFLERRDDEYAQTARDAELFIALAEDDADKRVLRNMVGSADLVIDALFGIGVRIPIRDEAQKILRQTKRAINERSRTTPEKLVINPAKTGQIPRVPKVKVLAIDCPSGMNCDTGEVDSNVIRADETITFIAAKHGQFKFPAASIIGDLSVADIGVSPKLETIKSVNDYVIDAAIVQEKLPERPLDSHKGTYGRALIVAGSVNYVGAPALSAEAAYRSGAGLVSVAAPSTVVLPLMGQLREVTWFMLPHDMGVIADGAASVVAKELHKMAALLVGPGINTEKTTGEFLEKLLKQPQSAAKKPKRSLGFGTSSDDNNNEDDETVSLPPLVIDADGLNLLAEIDTWWELLPENTILTPHPAEMGRLTGIETSEVQSNRWNIARENATKWNCVVVLKGAHTLIATPSGEVYVLPFKTDALATAGTGDVLAGLITGFLAQKVDAIDAAIVGSYVHGLAGMLAAEDQNSRSVLASDVISQIGEALQRIVQS